MYHVAYSQRARKHLGKIDPSARRKIKRWIEKYLDGCEDPRLYGKALKGQFDDLWRYRVGEYRILAHINDAEVLIVIVDAEHRKSVYR